MKKGAALFEMENPAKPNHIVVGNDTKQDISYISAYYRGVEPPTADEVTFQPLDSSQS